MRHSSESKTRQILSDPLSAVNRRIVKMQHDSLFTCAPALWIADFGQRAQHRFYEVCAIHLLSIRGDRNLVFPCAIEENHEHSFLMKMRGPLNFINIISGNDPPRSMVISTKQP
jgi:hypothetical protein